MLNENKIADAIRDEGFSTHTIALIDNYISQIFNGKKILLNSIRQSMQVSVVQVRCSLGRTSYATTRKQALQQVQMLEEAKQSQRTGK